MTRFARSKGSKASNERTPNEATPWHLMREQLTENLAKKQGSSGKVKSAKELLKEKEEPFYYNTTGNIKHDWAEFEESKKAEHESGSNSKKRIKEKKKRPITSQEVQIKEKTPSNGAKSSDSGMAVVGSSKDEKKRALKRKAGATFDDNQSEHKTKQFKKGPMKGSKNINNASNKFGKNRFNNGNPNNKKKAPKIRDDKEHKRKKPDTGPTKVMINGIEIEIVRYDGFLINKEDAERLKHLKQEMIMKGIPKADMDAAMKLERRRAEKALVRIKKSVCFHCRKAGHNLSDCPELGSEQAATGICFKCGSTEHTHFECKVAKATEYRYASCFICREQGHIAKQCPDNPKGVYPQGGACKICGDVTHLKKDCPDLAKEKEETAITLDTIANDTLESLEESSKNVRQKDNTNPKKKIVKF